MKKVSIIIPSFNGKKLFEELLPSLVKHIDQYIEVIIVDNGSSDGTCDWLKENYPQFELVSLTKNLGFTGGVNSGVKIATGKWLLILNNDCFINKSTIESLINHCLKNQFIASSPLLVDREGILENAGYFVDLKVGKVRLNTDHSKTDLDSKKDFVFGLTAACLLIDRRVFSDLGGLDESFHSYLEDVDLFIRLHRAGYHYGVTGEEKVVHRHMSTSKNMGNFKQKQDVKNWWRIMIKHHSIFELLVNFSFWFPERLRNLSGLIKTYFK